MEIEIAARVHAHELLLAQLISEYLRTVPDPAAQARYAAEQLHRAADALPVAAGSLDEEARLRVQIKETIAGILDVALKRTQAGPSQARSWDTGPQFGA